MKRILSLIAVCIMLCSLYTASAAAKGSDWDAQCNGLTVTGAMVYHMHTDEAEGVQPVGSIPTGTKVRILSSADGWTYIDYMKDGAVMTGAIPSSALQQVATAAVPAPTAVPVFGEPVVPGQADQEGFWVERYGSYTCLVYSDGIADEVLTSSLTFSDEVDADHQIAMVKAGSASRITMRSRASSKGSAVAQCPVGTIVPVLSISNGFAKILYGDHEGWVSTGNLQFDIVVDEILGYGTLTMENPKVNSIINIRAKTSTNAAKVAEWFPGNEVAVIRRTGDWYEVEAYGTRGFVKVQYVTLQGE